VIAIATLSAGLTLGAGVQLASAAIPGDPSDGSEYGWSWSQFPTVAMSAYNSDIPDAEFPAAGGISSSSRDFPSVGCNVSEPNLQPAAITISEPFHSSNYYGDNTIMLGLKAVYLPDSDDSPCGAQASVGTPSSGLGTTTTVVCGTSSWTEPGDTFTRSFVGYGNAGSPDTVGGGTTYRAGEASTDSGGCPYIISMTAAVSTWNGIGPVFQDYQVTWTAAQAESPKTYKVETPAEIACAAATSAESTGACETTWKNDPENVASCGTPPNWQPFDVTTYGNFLPWLVFWPPCWFVPKGGFDTGGTIDAAVTASGVGQLNTDFADMAVYASIPESCGVIFNGAASHVGPTSFAGLSVNTCDWSAWSGITTLKFIVGLGVTIGFGWWAIQFALGTLTGIYTKKTPAPGSSLADQTILGEI
jgi:hypothetical protein